MISIPLSERLPGGDSPCGYFRKRERLPHPQTSVAPLVLAQVTLELTFPPEHRFCHELSTKCVRAPSVVAIASAVTLMLRSMRWQEREGRPPFVEPEPRRDARQSAAVIRGKANAPSGWRWRLQPRSSVCRVGAFFVLVKTKAPDSESSDEPIRSRPGVGPDSPLESTRHPPDVHRCWHCVA